MLSLAKPAGIEGGEIATQSEIAVLREQLIGAEKRQSDLKVCLWEACAEQDKGNIGAYYIQHWAERAGVKVDVIRPGSSKAGYDVELVSVHHCTDLPCLANERKHGRIRIIGGHITFSNPRPLIPFGDVICLGDGESWMYEAMSRLIINCEVEQLRGLPGTIICRDWTAGDEVPPLNYEDPLPDNPPYLNRALAYHARWYIEIARGCPYSCAYCELGNSMPYRYYDFDHILSKLDMTDVSRARRISWFAPDESSHPAYNDLMRLVVERGYRQDFGSYRIDQVLRNKIEVKKGQLIRVGVDGLTEETRYHVKKKISNDMIIRYFRTLLMQGHHAFKIFMMFAYPWERLSDFDEFETVMDSIVPMIAKHKAHLRVKWTPLIPQPCTPLGKETAKYDPLMEIRIKEWHKKVRGFGVECDGIMSKDSHDKQIALTQATETYLLPRARGYINQKWRNHGI